MIKAGADAHCLLLFSLRAISFFFSEGEIARVTFLDRRLISSLRYIFRLFYSFTMRGQQSASSADGTPGRAYCAPPTLRAPARVPHQYHFLLSHDLRRKRLCQRSRPLFSCFGWSPISMPFAGFSGHVPLQPHRYFRLLFSARALAAHFAALAGFKSCCGDKLAFADAFAIDGATTTLHRFYADVMPHETMALGIIAFRTQEAFLCHAEIRLLATCRYFIFAR